MARKHTINPSMFSKAFYQHIFKLYHCGQNTWKKSFFRSSSILFRAMADSKYQYGDNWNQHQKHPDAGKNLWLGSRSCSHSFEKIVELIGGRFPMVNKDFSNGGFCWVLTADKGNRNALKQELEQVGGFNFGRDSEAYIAATAHSGRTLRGVSGGIC